MEIMIKHSALSLIFSLSLVLGFGAVAGAQAQDDECEASSGSETCDVPAGVLPSAPETAAPAAPAAPIAVQPKQTLPVTGTETAGLALGGLVLVAAGGALVWRSNKAAA